MKTQTKPTATPKPCIITRSKGGAGECKMDLAKIQIPDVFNYGESPYDRNVVEVWHLAHDLKRELLERNNEHDALNAVAEAAKLITCYKPTCVGNLVDSFGTTYTKTVASGRFADLEIAITNLAAVRKGGGK